MALPKSSVYRHLCTLEERGYVERDEEAGIYRTGPAFFFVLDEHLLLLRRCARPYLQELREQFGETINLGILDRTRIAYLDIVESPRALRMASRVGDREPIHSTALGKAIAANLDEADVSRILRVEGMPQQTDRTITDPGDLFAELEDVRKRGYAMDNGESDSGGRCIAVAAGSTPIPYALSLSAPAARFLPDRVDEVAAELKSAVATLERDVSSLSATV
jgi:IclR family acetate operon transcriptional repressor